MVAVIDTEAEIAKLTGYYQAGRLEAALASAKTLIAVKSNDPGLLRLAGGLAIECKAFDDAIETLKKASVIEPENAETLFLLARAFSGKRYLQRAEDCLKQAITLSPDYLAPRLNLGNLYMQQGHTDEAIRHYRALLETWPNCTDAQNNLSTLLSMTESGLEALEEAEKTAEMRSEDATSQMKYGDLLTADGNYKKSELVYRKALNLDPKSSKAICGLAKALISQEKRKEALAVLREARLLHPTNIDIANMLGKELNDAKRYAEASGILTEVLSTRSLSHNQWAWAMAQQSEALMHLGRLRDAENIISTLLEKAPEYNNLYLNRAFLRQRRGAHELSISDCQALTSIRPHDPSGYHNFLYFLSYHPSASQADVFKEAETWARALRKTLPKDAVKPLKNKAPKGRKIKVGYISPDLVGHVVTYFLAGILENHDRERFEIHLFASIKEEDSGSKRMQTLCDHWHMVYGKPDAEVADLIRKQEIDILIDLAGHTAGTRVNVLAYKPAPVQATWIGYPNTTGLSEIDYRLTDDIADPEGPDDAFYSEKLVRLKKGFLTYEPPKGIAESGDTPALKHGYVTFGCFNQARKLNRETLHLWARIVNNVPKSRLLLKGRDFNIVETKAVFIDMLEEAGLDRHRVSVIGQTKGYVEHVALFQKVDIALDPFPYNGTTTTCETLWMNVPVVTKLGNIHAARVSASLIDQIGLTDLLVGKDDDDYAEKACALASDLVRLNKLRRSMRQRLRGSRLMDHKGHTREVEEHFVSWMEHWWANHEKI